MRFTLPNLASSISKKPLASSAFSSPPVRNAASQLLGPIPLYRRLLRVHRKALPIEMRVLGDDYVKSEFRRTRSTDNPLHVVGFLSEWKKYLDFHERQIAAVEGEDGAEQRMREGQKLQTQLFEKLSAEQMGQLYELLQATKDVWADPAEVEKERQAAKLTAGEPISSPETQK